MTDLERGPSSSPQSVHVSGVSSDPTPLKPSGDIVERLRAIPDYLMILPTIGMPDQVTVGALAHEAAAEIERLRREKDEAADYLRGLLVSYVNEHCDPVPAWKPLPDLLGMLTQMDNASTVTREIKSRALTAESALAGAMEALKPFADLADICDRFNHPDTRRMCKVTIDGITTDGPSAGHCRAARSAIRAASGVPAK